MRVKTTAISGAKKLKSGMGISRSLSWRGLKFPIQRDARFMCEDNFQIKKRYQQLHNSSFHTQQSINPSTSIQTQKTQKCNMCFETKVQNNQLQLASVNPLMNHHVLPNPKVNPQHGSHHLNALITSII